MKTIFKNTHQRLSDSGLFGFVDRDRGQVDRYDSRPAVKFPCALVKVNFPKRENLHPTTQKIIAQIQIRVAFERTVEQHNLQPAQRLDQALEYYDAIEEIETLFQGLKLGGTDRWTCTSTVDEDRADFDIVRITFSTRMIKEY